MLYARHRARGNYLKIFAIAWGYDMDRYEKDSLYDWYVENCTKDEIPLNYNEWEREIYPKELAQIKRINKEK
jgi:hypothetical protein